MPGNQVSLHDHALRLHHQDPDAVLPDEGEPYPDARQHRGERPRSPRDLRAWGAAPAAILDAYFARPGAQPGELAWAFHDVFVPVHRSEHIAAAALRADRLKVQETGRWLVRHSPDRCSALIGMALLAADWAEEDIEPIKIIGLLSDKFCALAADALKRRRGGGAEALLWLAERVTDWGRVYIVEALCLVGGTTVRPWLLRHACDGSFLNGYFAGKVATAAHLHEAITAPDADDAVIDHTGRLLRVLADCQGMGMTWRDYPPIRLVLDAHAGHLSGQAPSATRYANAAVIADHLACGSASASGLASGHRDDLLDRYRAVLHRTEWAEVAGSTS
jgi:hypothetical protein